MPVLSTAAGQAVTPGDEEAFKNAADRLERMFKNLESLRKDLAREQFDPRALAGQLKDPAAAFTWVRDQTYWVPYHGALRGAQGVLLDRLGNSLDRSLLLAMLLHLNGQSVRLARADLPADQARTLLGKLRPVPAQPAPAQAAMKAQEIDALASRYTGGDASAAAELRQSAEQSLRDAQALSDTARGRGESEFKSLLQKIGAGPAAPEQETAALDALRDHWWVQRREGDAWIDMDPLTADAQPGAAVAAAAQTVELDPFGQPVGLDSRWCQEVEVRVVAEQYKAGAAHEAVLLRQTMRPWEIFGQQVIVSHIPMGWPADLTPGNPKATADSIKAAALNQHDWLPVIVVGTKQATQASVSDSGEVNEKPNLAAAGSPGGAVANTLQKAADLFGDAGDAPAAKPQEKGDLTAEWIEYHIRPAAGPERVIRREVFDLLGPAARKSTQPHTLNLNDSQRLDRAFALLAGTEVLVLPCRLSSEYVTDLGIDRVLANKTLLPDVFRQAAQMPPEKLAEKLRGMTPGLGPLYSLALARHDWNWNAAADDVYVSSPNILAHRQRVRVHPDGRMMACESFDIVANDVAVRSGAANNAFEARMAQGVADTNAEAFLLAGCGRVENTAEAFADSRDWTVVKPGDSASLGALQVSDDTRARLEQDVAGGVTVVVPTKPADSDGRKVTSWWRIDPASGQTLGMGGHGEGSSATEYSLMTRVLIGVAGFDLCMFARNLTSDPSHNTFGRDVAGCALVAVGASLATTGLRVLVFFAAIVKQGGRL
jgi:hypothetical protein